MISGVVPDGSAGSLPPQGDGLRVLRGSLAWRCYAVMAAWWLSSPAATRGSQPVPCTMRE